MTVVSNLLSPEELLGLRADERLRLIDARFELADLSAGRAAWQAGHIPGAVHLDLAADLSGPAGSGGRHPLPAVAALERTFGAAGIGADSRVVVYDQGVMMFASRVWWTLRWLGFSSVQVLDGGFAAWQAAGLPVSREPSPPLPQQFRAQPDGQLLASRQEVAALSGQPDALLIDARSPERFRGENETLDAWGGHIPGAVNRFYQDALEGGRFRPVHELRRLFADAGAAGTTVMYCGSGVSATVNLLAMAEAGYALPRLYVGSWSDWSSAAGTGDQGS